MPVYVYHQNNSGGRFIGPAVNIIVEAGTAEEADAAALSAGAYFDGVSRGQDCGCCGDRWYPAWGNPDHDTVEEAVAALTGSRYRSDRWEEEAGGLYVVVRPTGKSKLAVVKDLLTSGRRLSDEDVARCVKILDEVLA